MKKSKFDTICESVLNNQAEVTLVTPKILVQKDSKSGLKNMESLTAVH